MGDEGIQVIKSYPRHAINLDMSAYVKYTELLRDGELSEGRRILEFEKAWSEFVGAANTVAVGSARAGFYLTLRGMGIGPGDEVIMPAYTFPSMPAAVAATGARPVFVDVDAKSYNLDPELTKGAVTGKTKAIVVAHLFGRAAQVERLREIADAAGASLIEDCAHAAGAVKSLRRVGSFGDAAVFSFGIGKNMPCFGGGAITFADRELAGKVRKLVGSSPAPEDIEVHRKVWSSLPAFVGTRKHVFPWTLYVAARVLDSAGSDAMDRAVREPLEKTTHFSLRALGRMSNLQASVALQQIEKLPARNATLARNGRYLAELLEGVEGVTPPGVVEGEEHIYLYFRILVDGVGRFRTLLLKKGIDTQADDMADCAGLEAFKEYRADCPVAASLPGRSIELPNNVLMTRGDFDYVARCVREAAQEIAAPEGAGKQNT